LGHKDRRPIIERINSNVYVDKYTQCWLWQKYIGPSGYAVSAWRDYRTTQLHRLVYKLLVGPISPQHHLHHLCEVKHCLNIWHLVAILPDEHIFQHEMWINAVEVRQQKAKLASTCRKGHPRTKENTYIARNGNRYCKVCQKLNYLERRSASAN
jgi:hypothetical protein